MNITKKEMASAFAEWHRRWAANPDDFQTDEDTLAESPEENGQGSMEYFVKIIKEQRI